MLRINRRSALGRSNVLINAVVSVNNAASAGDGAGANASRHRS
jgi:hypothetical protein